MTKTIDFKKGSISFMTKKEFIERKGSECFSVNQDVDEKLKEYADNEILAIEVSINSPATVIDVHKVENIVDFMNDNFMREGVSQMEINESFKFQ